MNSWNLESSSKLTRGFSFITCFYNFTQRFKYFSGKGPAPGPGFVGPSKFLNRKGKHRAILRLTLSHSMRFPTSRKCLLKSSEKLFENVENYGYSLSMIFQPHDKIEANGHRLFDLQFEADQSRPWALETQFSLRLTSECSTFRQYPECTAMIRFHQLQSNRRNQTL